jgi:hypothetical protein
MKYTKAAMAAHHVQFGQMATMKPTHVAEDRVDDRGTGPARTYSTERYAPPSAPTGISIPQQLRNRIEASNRNPAATVETVSTETSSTFLGWGFF